MDKQLSKKLKDCGIKKSKIETLLEMPKNSLAGMMNGTRPTPDKWVKKLQTFLGDLIPLPSDYVLLKGIKVLANEASADISEEAKPPKNLFDEMQEAFKKMSPFVPKPGSDLYIPEGPRDGEPVTVTINTAPIPDSIKEFTDDVNYALAFTRKKQITLKELCERYELMLAQSSIPIKKESKFTEPVVKKGRDYNPNDNWRYKSKLGEKKQ